MILIRIQPPVQNSSKQSPAYVSCKENNDTMYYYHPDVSTGQMVEQLHCKSATNDLKYYSDL
jgi:hypothetical protein